MKQDHQTSFGRHVSAVPVARADENAGLVDKWKLLNALTEAANDYGLNHRTLSVLRALLGFHPDRMISATHLSTIVFPANRTLSTRLGGMPESTLRRHLAALISAGVVNRHDSANRKRFARGRAGGTAVAFGFDLSPLARLAAQLSEQAQQAAEKRSRLQALRAELASLRQDVILEHGVNEITEEAFRVLRRKPDATLLNAAITRLKDGYPTPKMSATDNQNERHIQGNSIILSEGPTLTSEEAEVQSQQKKEDAQFEEPSLEAIVEQCKEHQVLFPNTGTDWQGLSRTAYALAPMMGVERSVYAEAVEAMGAKKAIAVILVMLEGLSDITNPGGYLRRLTQQFRAGAFDMPTLTNRFLKNLGNCQLTT